VTATPANPRGDEAGGVGADSPSARLQLDVEHRVRTFRSWRAVLDADNRLPTREEVEGRHSEACYHSIRIKDQWRIVFRWTDSGPAEVDIRAYH
jgi:hypothetical protein